MRRARSFISSFPRTDLMSRDLISWRVLFHSPSTWLVLSGLVAIWLGVVAGRILWNGEVFGLYYGLWFPDGTYYSYKAFLWGGYTPQEAANFLTRMYQPGGEPLPAEEPGKPPIYDSRILYPLLSGPLTAMFGIWGLLVIPSLGLLAAALVPAAMLLRRGLALAAFIGSALALSSTSLARWTVANLTEGLILGLIALMLPLLPWNHRKVSMRSALALATLAVAASLTRQVLPVLALLVVVPWLLRALSTRRLANEWFSPAIAVTVPSAVVFVATLPRDTFWLVPISQDAGGLGGLSLTERIVRFPVETLRMTVIEIGQLVILDRGLLLLLLLSLAGVVLLRREPIAHAWLGIVIASVFLTAWVGAGGVNFRYALPLIPLAILATGGLWTLRKPTRLP